MVFPFGISISDFIAGIHVLKESVKALDDSYGATAEYRELSCILASLENALTSIDGLRLDPSQCARYQAIKNSVEGCRECTNKFISKIVKFKILEKQLGGDGKWSLSFLKGIARRIQWSLCKKEDVAQFRDEVAGHVDAIQMLLLTFQMCEKLQSGSFNCPNREAETSLHCSAQNLKR